MFQYYTVRLPIQMRDLWLFFRLLHYMRFSSNLKHFFFLHFTFFRRIICIYIADYCIHHLYFYNVLINNIFYENT